MPNGELLSIRFAAIFAKRKHIGKGNEKRWRSTGRSEVLLARQLHHCYKNIRQLQKNVSNATIRDKVNRQMIWRAHRHNELKHQLSLTGMGQHVETCRVRHA